MTLSISRFCFFFFVLHKIISLVSFVVLCSSTKTAIIQLTNSRNVKRMKIHWKIILINWSVRRRKYINLDTNIYIGSNVYDLRSHSITTSWILAFDTSMQGGHSQWNGHSNGVSLWYGMSLWGWQNNGWNKKQIEAPHCCACINTLKADTHIQTLREKESETQNYDDRTVWLLV